MELAANSLLAGVFAAAFGILLTTPPRGLFACALCGTTGRLVRDLFIAWGTSMSWATVLASMAVVVVAFLALRGRQLARVSIICGVFPLGAAQAVFETIIGLLQIASIEGRLVQDASVALVANAGRAFTVTLSQAVGIAIGLGLVEATTRMVATRMGYRS